MAAKETPTQIARNLFALARHLDSLSPELYDHTTWCGCAIGNYVELFPDAGLVITTDGGYGGHPPAYATYPDFSDEKLRTGNGDEATVKYFEGVLPKSEVEDVFHWDGHFYSPQDVAIMLETALQESGWDESKL